MAGATDCRNNLMGILDALEFLLSQDFEPKRTIVAGFGFDEEISYSLKLPKANNHRGPQGASNISALLLERYGRDSIEFIIDEGGSEVKNIYGATFALPGTAEKGYFDVKVRVSGEGGHSSVPPEHTTIGQLSKVIELIENNPWEPILTRASRTSPRRLCVPFLPHFHPVFVVEDANG